MLLLPALALAYILVVWFKTDAFVEYATLTRLRTWSVLENYDKLKTPGNTFPTFLAIDYDNFFVRLITCPVCLSFWLALLPSVLAASFVYIPILSCFLSGIGLALFALALFVCHVFALAGLSLFFYLVFAKLI